MANWVNLETISFPLRGVELVISVYAFARYVLGGGDDTTVVGRLVSHYVQDPVALEQALRITIESLRPEYTGCTIEYMGYAPDERGFYIGILHPQLEMQPKGSRFPSEPMIRDVPFPSSRDVM